MKMKSFSLILTILFFVTSCFEQVPTGTREIAGQNQEIGVGDVGGSVDGNGVVPVGDGGLNSDGTITAAKVEIRHLIEPEVDTNSNSGKYTRKLTIPKNYNGLLYVAGINISSLADKNLRVRFKFGLNSSPITVPATIQTGAGITPATNVEVLVIDMRNRPFNNIQLPYDLFDYNQYEFDPNATPGPGELTEPVDYNRDENLFCRALRLEDDPTFTGSLADGCTQSSDICKYAYAKIVDKGLVDTVLNVPVLPTEINIAAEGLIYDDDSDNIKIQRCLPDNPDLGNYVYDSRYTFSNFSSVPTAILDPDSNPVGTYSYQGPYQSNDFLNWEIKEAAILSPLAGVFGGHNDIDNDGLMDFLTESNSGYKSRLFPLYTKFNLAAGIEYMGSSQADGVKTLKETLSNGLTEYMDGCNERVSSEDDFTGEHVGSCTATSKIEIIAIEEDGSENIIDSTIEVKLQLVKSEEIRSSGENLLLSSFQSCNSSSQCGSDSCCINKRCWSKTIVSQCVEDFDNFGDLAPGDSCNSDHQCASLCCNRTSGKCAVQDTNADPPVYCSKPAGQSCISKEFCQKYPITRCFIVNTGFDAQGGATCALRCYNYEEFGDCVGSNGQNDAICVPPQNPEQPVFNPNDPNRCADAINESEVPLNNTDN